MLIWLSTFAVLQVEKKATCGLNVHNLFQFAENKLSDEGAAVQMNRTRKYTFSRKQRCPGS